MSRRGAVAVAAVCLGTLVVTPSAAAADAPPAFRLQDDDITESSALVVSRTDPSLAYTVDDSGGAARIFVVDTGSGETVGVTTLAGVDNVDFEALAFAPGPRLLVGDIGDNDADRSSVRIHLIDEPAPGTETVRPRTTELTYADGPRDAEALLVRHGRILVVSKRLLGGRVYQGPSLRALPAHAVLRPVAKAPGTVTDATVLADGRVVLRNYTAAFVMTPDWEIAQTIRLPATELGESSAAPPEGRWFYAGTEGEHAPVFRIDVPAADPRRSEPAPAVPPPRPATEQDERAVGELLAWAGAGLVAVLVVLLAVWWALRRVRRGSGAG